MKSIEFREFTYSMSPFVLYSLLLFLANLLFVVFYNGPLYLSSLIYYLMISGGIVFAFVIIAKVFKSTQVFIQKKRLSMSSKDLIYDTLRFYAVYILISFALFIIYIINFLIRVGNSTISSTLLVRIYFTHYNLYLTLIEENALLIFIIFIGTIIILPVFFELFFRKIFWDILDYFNYFPEKIILILTTIIYTISQLGLISSGIPLGLPELLIIVTQISVSGFLFGSLYMRTHNIRYAIYAHIMWNVIEMVLFLISLPFFFSAIGFSYQIFEFLIWLGIFGIIRLGGVRFVIEAFKDNEFFDVSWSAILYIISFVAVFFFINVFVLSLVIEVFIA